MIRYVTPSGVVVESPVALGDVSVKQCYTVTLTGGDGRVWNLNTGPVFLLAGARLFEAPRINHWLRSSPGLDGVRWDGMRTEHQEPTLPVEIVGRDWSDYRDVETDFFRSIAPEREVTLTVTAPDGRSRSLSARFQDEDDLDLERDVLLDVRTVHSIEFVAPSPFWRGQQVSKVFEAEAPQDFFSGDPFYISPSTTTESATISNRGDVDVWPVYRVTGPAATWSVGVNGQVVSSSTAVREGETIVVDTDPRRRSITSEGARVFEDMTEVNFAALPPGEKVALDLAMTEFGEGSQIVVEFTELYRRPL